MPALLPSTDKPPVVGVRQEGMLRMTAPTKSSTRPMSMPSLQTGASSSDDDSIDDAGTVKLQTPLRPIMPAHLQRVVIAATWSPVPYGDGAPEVRVWLSMNNAAARDCIWDSP